MTARQLCLGIGFGLHLTTVLTAGCGSPTVGPPRISRSGVICFGSETCQDDVSCPRSCVETPDGSGGWACSTTLVGQAWCSKGENATPTNGAWSCNPEFAGTSCTSIKPVAVDSSVVFEPPPSVLSSFGFAIVELVPGLFGGPEPTEPKPESPPVEPEPPAEPEVATSCTSWGDPHLTSCDGLLYDFQAAGTFVAAEDGPGFAVQVHQTQLGVGAVVSVNSAIAAQVGNHTVAVYINRSPEQTVWVDNQPVALDVVRTFAEGGGVSADGNGAVTVSWPGGDSATLSVAGGYYADVYLNVSARRRARMRGVLGDFDGDPNNDLALPDGEVLAQPISDSDLHGRYAEAWSVKPAAALFDPQLLQQASNAPAPAAPSMDEATATATCQQAGVSDLQLAGCVHDLMITGDAALAASAEQATEPTAVLVEGNVQEAEVPTAE